MERELVLGNIKIGDPYTEARKDVGRLYPSGRTDVYFNDHWSLWLDTENKTVKGVSFEERGGIVRNEAYPNTGRGVTLGSSRVEVERIYGKPEQTLMGKAPFVLRTSELALIYVYPSQGLWIMFTNQKPFSERADWRVSLISIGEAEVIEAMREASEAYAMPLNTRHVRQRVFSLYTKSFGKDAAKDPLIFDDYQYALQTALYEHVIKSEADPVITPVMIIPRNKRKAKALVSAMSPSAPLYKELDRQAREKTTATHGISDRDLDRIIGNIVEFKQALAAEDTDTKNAGGPQREKLLAGSANK
jgi:hypothetical protein